MFLSHRLKELFSIEFSSLFHFIFEIFFYWLKSPRPDKNKNGVIYKIESVETWVRPGFGASVPKSFFFKIPRIQPKTHENHEQKSSKSQKNHGVSAEFPYKLTPLVVFIAFLCINIFQKIKKLEKIFMFWKKIL